MIHKYLTLNWDFNFNHDMVIIVKLRFNISVRNISVMSNMPSEYVGNNKPNHNQNSTYCQGRGT